MTQPAAPMVGANQPVHRFLGGKGLSIQQGTSVWVGSPKSNSHPKNSEVIKEVRYVQYNVPVSEEIFSIIGRDPRVPKSNRSHVDICWFFFTNFRYILQSPLK